MILFFCCRFNVDEPLKWKESFEKLLSSQSKYNPSHHTFQSVQMFSDDCQMFTCTFFLLSSDGLCMFRAFLVSEFSEENIAFYLACENYRTSKPSKLATKAKKIYDEFIGSDAPREVNKSNNQETHQDVLSSPVSRCSSIHHLCASLCVSTGKSRPCDQGYHKGKHGASQPVLFWPGRRENLHPDGEGLLPSLPQILHIPGAQQKDQGRRVDTLLRNFPVRSRHDVVTPEKDISLVTHSGDWRGSDGTNTSVEGVSSHFRWMLLCFHTPDSKLKAEGHCEKRLPPTEP